MNDFALFAARTRRWGYVALAFSALPGAALTDRLLSHGLNGPLVHVAVPFVVLAVVGATLVAAGAHLSRALAAGADPGTLPELRATPFRAPARLVIYMSGALFLFSGVTAPLCGCTTREKAYEGAMKSDLRNLQSAQEIHAAEHDGAYASSLAELRLTSSEGVTVALRLEPDGWTARAVHAGLPESSCVIHVGEVERPFRTLSGQEAPEAGSLHCHPRAR